jgi:hypothetical protein
VKKKFVPETIRLAAVGLLRPTGRKLGKYHK